MKSQSLKGSRRHSMFRIKDRTCPIWPSKAADEETNIMTPRSPSGPSGFVVVMWGRHCRTRSSVPRRLMFRTKSIADMGAGSLLRSTS